MFEDLCEKCRQEQRDANPHVSIDVFITCNHNQPERSKREDLIEQLQQELIERSKLNVEIVKSRLGCGALNTVETS